MPKYYKQNLLSGGKKHNVGDHTLQSPLDTPELPEGHYLGHYDPLELEPVQLLLSWEAPSRPYRKKNRSYYVTTTVIVILIGLIALLLGQKILFAAILAYLFVVYVLNFVPPDNVQYRISTQGVTIGQHFYHWQELDSFWFSKQEGHTVIHILTNIYFPGELMLVLKDVDEDQVKDVVAHFLPFHEIAPKSTMDKWADSLQKHFPLERPQKILQ